MPGRDILLVSAAVVERRPELGMPEAPVRVTMPVLVGSGIGQVIIDLVGFGFTG